MDVLIFLTCDIQTVYDDANRELGTGAKPFSLTNSQPFPPQLLHKIHTSPQFHTRSQSLHLEKRADEVTSTTLAPPALPNTAASTTANPTLSGASETKLETNAISSGGSLNVNGKEKAKVTPNETLSSSLNGTAGGTKVATGGNTSPTVPTTAPALSWTAVVGDTAQSKESSEECPFGFLQCFCDAVTDMLVSSEEDDDDDQLTDGIFGIFGK